MNKFKGVLMALLMAVPMLVIAEPVAQSESVKQQTVDELMTITHFDQLINDSIETSIQGLKQMLPGLADHEQELKAFYQKTMDPKVLHQEVGQIYMEMFTEQELKDLIAFYRTPTGQKALQKLPEIMQRSMELAQSRLMANQAELIQLMEKVAKEQAAKQQPAREAVQAQ